MFHRKWVKNSTKSKLVAAKWLPVKHGQVLKPSEQQEMTRNAPQHSWWWVILPYNMGTDWLAVNSTKLWLSLWSP
jgi:hypothetical protein